MRRKRFQKSSRIYHKYIDENQWDLEYVDSIVGKMFKDEAERWKPLGYIEDVQKKKSFPRMRGAVWDYLSYFHKTYRIKDEHTLFKAIQIFDLYLSNVEVSK